MLLASIVVLSSTKNIVVVALRRDSEGIAGEDVVCVDSMKFNIKKRRTKVRMKLCDWAEEKKDKRCKQSIKKKVMVVDDRGNRKRVNKWIKVEDECGCVCAQHKAAIEETTGERYCPDITSLSQIANKNCRIDGHDEGKICSYGYLWTGCFYGELQCQPRFRCTCGDPFATGGRKDKWQCVTADYEGVGQYSPCPQELNPLDPRDPVPDDWLPLPDEAGRSCNKGDPTPMDPTPPAEESTSVEAPSVEAPSVEDTSVEDTSEEEPAFVTDESPEMLGLRRNILQQ